MATKRRATTAYFLFSEENRKAIQNDLQGEGSGKVSVAVVAKALGEKWRALTDEEKLKYKEAAKQRDVNPEAPAPDSADAGEADAAPPAAVAATSAAADTADAGSAAADEAADGDGAEPGDAQDAAVRRDQGSHPSPPPKDASCGAVAAAAGAPGSPHLPRGSVKRLMLCDADVSRATSDAVWLMGRAAELFVGMLAARGAQAAAAKKRSTIRCDDFEAVVRRDRRLVQAGLLDVLSDQAGREAAAAERREKAAAAAAECGGGGEGDGGGGAAAEDGGQWAGSRKRQAGKGGGGQSKKDGSAGLSKITSFFAAK